MRKLVLGVGLAAFLGFSATVASASTITLTVGGTITSATVDPGDSVFTNATTGDAYSLVLTYDPSAFATSASLVFTDTSQSESTSLTNSDGSYTFTSPGVYGAGTTAFNFSDSNSDYVNLYFSGAITGLGDTTGLSGLSAYLSASPSPFEWLFNFSDGGQTDLQGSFNSVTAVPSNTVPEPATLWLLAPGLLLAALYFRRREAADCA